MKILIAGDFCPRERVAEIFEREDYSNVLSEIRELTSNVDYSIVNFECPVVTCSSNPIEKQGPNLKCTSNGVAAIKYAGFDCVTLANNHFYDFGESGVKETLITLDRFNISHVGGGMNIQEASQILYKEISGKKIAIINCCEHEFSIASAMKAGSNPLNPVRQYYAIQEARCNADNVIVIVHGGHEHFQLPSLRMVETYRFFIDAGADAVVNHHQHCYSGYEVYNGKPIFYGLGNFCFDNHNKRCGIWTEGYMVLIDFGNETPIFTLLPYIQCSNEPKVKMLPKTAFNSRFTELNSQICNPSKLREALNKYYLETARGYSNIFEPINNRFYLGAKRRGWLPSFISKDRKLKAYNFILCESHRDKLQFWFENK